MEETRLLVGIIQDITLCNIGIKGFEENKELEEEVTWPKVVSLTVQETKKLEAI